jgi:hypothetical protein
MPLAAFAAAAAAAAAVAAASASPSALERAAQAVAERFTALLLKAKASETTVGVVVSAPEAPELSRAAQTALVSKLAQTGLKAVFPLTARPEVAEAEARARGLDFLLRAAVRVDGAELLLGGDGVPTWVNLFAGQDPIRAEGGGAFAVRVAADAEALALARLPLGKPPRPQEGAARFALRSLARLNERVVAVTIGDLDGDGVAEIALQLPTAVVVLRADGQPLVRREQAGLPRSPRPPREPAGALAIAPGAGPGEPRARLSSYSFALARGEVLELVGAELRPVQGLEAPALASGAAGLLAGVAQPGKNLFATQVKLSSGPSAALPFSPLSVAANPRAFGPAFLAVAGDGAAALLSPELKSLELSLPPLGACAALGDFDGDGAAELLTSALVRSEDRARIWRPDGRPGTSLFESEPIAGAFEACAAGDLDGDGRDEAVLAAWNADGTSTIYSLAVER